MAANTSKNTASASSDDLYGVNNQSNLFGVGDAEAYATLQYYQNTTKTTSNDNPNDSGSGSGSKILDWVNTLGTNTSSVLNSLANLRLAKTGQTAPTDSGTSDIQTRNQNGSDGGSGNNTVFYVIGGLLLLLLLYLIFRSSSKQNG